MNYQTGKTIGNTTEFKFFTALQADVRSMPYWFLGVRRATGLEDAAGVDAFVTLDVGEVEVQIKTSETGMVEYEKTHRGNGVLVIVIGVHASISYAKDRILHYLYLRRGAMIGPYLQKCQRARH